MKAKKISFVVVILAVILITACDGAQMTEVISSEVPEIENNETRLTDDEHQAEKQKDPPLVLDSEPLLRSNNIITQKNANQLVEIQSYKNAPVFDFAWSPDGNTLALATSSRVSLIDIHTHEEIIWDSKKNFPSIGHFISFNPNGEMLAVSSGKQVEIYDTESQTKLFILDDFEDMGVFGIAFSPDNTKLATGWGHPWLPDTGSVKIWDMSSGKLVTELGRNLKETICNLAFNQEGDLLGTIGVEGQVRIWNILEETEVISFTGTSGYGESIAFSPDGSLLAVGGAASDGRSYSYKPAELHLFDLSSGDLLFDLEGHQSLVRSLSFNKDGDVLASASMDGTVHLWNPHTGQQLAFFDISDQTSDWTSVSFSPDGTRLATAGYGDVLRLWGVP